MASPSVEELETSSNRDQLVGGNLPSSSVTSSASSTSLSNPPRLSTTSSSQFTATSSQTHGSECNSNDVAESIYSPDDWFAKFHDPTDFDFFHTSNNLPTRADLDAAGEHPVYDLEGRAHPFKSLYSGPRHEGQRQLIIFLRHFYCGVSLQSPSSDLLQLPFTNLPPGLPSLPPRSHQGISSHHNISYPNIRYHNLLWFGHLPPILQGQDHNPRTLFTLHRPQPPFIPRSRHGHHRRSEVGYETRVLRRRKRCTDIYRHV